MDQTDDDYFRHRAIEALLGDLPAERQSKFRQWAKGRPLSVQLDALVIDAMKRYEEPDSLKERR